MKYIFTILSFFISSFLFCQDSLPVKKSRFVIDDLNINVKSRNVRKPVFDFFNSNLVNISQYFKEQEKVSGYLNNVGINNFIYEFPDIYNQYEIQLGLNVRNKKSGKINDRLSIRLGLSYVESSHMLTSRGRFEAYESNPIYLNPNTYAIYDSTLSYRLSISHVTRNLLIQPSIQIYTNSENQIQLFTGLSFGFGFSLQNQLNLLYNNVIRTSYQTYIDDVLKPELSESNVVQREEALLFGDLGNQLSTIISVPLGIRFRIGKNNELLKRIHFQIETRPAFLATYSKPTDWQSYKFISIHGGLAYRFRN